MPGRVYTMAIEAPRMDIGIYIPDPLKKYNLIFLLIQFIANFTPDYVLIIQYSINVEKSV